jgi:hypothetical protein
VSDEVDRPVDAPQLLGKPLGILVLGRAEAGRPVRSEPGQVEGDRVAVEVFANALPDLAGLGDTVDEDRWHACTSLR